ncbi:MAG: ABC transporter ATP-binding protein [Betaproteobacteria bacterium]
MLEITDLNVFYGGIHAVKDVSMRVEPGQIVTLIGANGAGKSSTLRAIAGLVQPRSGSIRFRGKEIVGRPTEAIIKSGLTLVPEGRKVFPNLTVRENLDLGAFGRNDRVGIAKDLEWVFHLFPRLEERQQQKAGTLSGGEQQMLALGRALMSRPALLMMDEPSLGLAPVLIESIFEVIRKIRAEGTTILLIEQNAFAALNAADAGYVLENGRIVMAGTGAELLANEDIQAAYLGRRRA